MSKSYVIMKDGTKIKTAKSLSSAKKIADQEKAEVFCDGECVYSAPIDNTSVSVSDVDAGNSSDNDKVVDELREEKQAPEEASKAVAVEADKEVGPASDVVVEADKADKKVNTVEKPDDKPSRMTSPYRLKALMNVREAPSLESKDIDRAPKDTVVEVYEIRNDWMRVNWKGGIAYILYKNGEFAEAAKG